MIENEIFDEKLLSIVAKFSRKHQLSKKVYSLIKENNCRLLNRRITNENVIDRWSYLRCVARRHIKLVFRFLVLC